MKKNTDAYGQQLLDAYREGYLDFEIVERDDGYIEASTHAQRYFADYKDWNKKEKKAAKLVKGKALDVGAGAGRHALYLQRKGYDVLAIDNSPGAIQVCRKRGVKNAKVLSIENINKLQGPFDTIWMMGNNFGLFGSEKKAKRLLKIMHKTTSAEAVIVAESNNPQNTKNPIHLAYQKQNKRKGNLPGQLRLRIRYKNIIGRWFDYLIVSPTEMKSILSGTGWKVTKTIPDTKDSTYIAVIEKIT